MLSSKDVYFFSFWCFMFFDANASDWTWHQADAQGRKAGGVIRGYLAASFEINQWHSDDLQLIIISLMLMIKHDADDADEQEGLRVIREVFSGILWDQPMTLNWHSDDLDQRESIRLGPKNSFLV